MTRRVAPPRLVAGVVALAIAVLASGCGEAAAPAAPAATSVAPAVADVSTTTSIATTAIAPSLRRYEFEQSMQTFVDASRGLPAGSATEQQPTRSIDVWIDAPLAPEPRPLVIFAHGLSGHPRSHELLRMHLAAEGFVVVSPAFPLTNNDVPGAFRNVGDTGEQIEDVSFLIDSVLADPELGPRIDAERIGMIGHSLGGLTTAGAALRADGDGRIDAAVVMSAGFAEARPDVAVMTVHGDQDELVPYSVGARSHQVATGRRLLVTLVGGTHLQGILDDDSDHGIALRGLAAAFFATELDVDEGQVAAIAELPLDDVRVEAGRADGPLDDWRAYFD